MKKLFTFMAAALFTITAGAANGEVTNGWLMVEDFENSPAITTFSYLHYEPIGTAKVIDNTTGTGTGGKVASFVGGDFNTVLEFNVTLPDGKTLKDYTQVAFDLYVKGRDVEKEDYLYKNMLVWADEFVIHQDDNYPKTADPDVWTKKTYAIPTDGNNIGKTFKLHIGILADDADYLIDNIRLKEKEEPGTSHNGETDDDGLLMVEDFEALQSVGMFNYLKYEEEGTASIVENPTVPDNKAASFVGGDFNTVLELDVTLPGDKVLSDYSDVVFDLYVKGRDVENEDYLHKNMLVWADEFVIHQDNNYPKTAEPDAWTEKTYAIPTDGNNIGKTFKLRIGILADDADYLIDNVRLKPATTTGITDVQAGAETVVVVDGGVMINAGAKAAYAVYDISGRAVSQGVADGSKTVTLQRGVYVVRVNGKAVKVLVR